jgi:HEAT repeat protein
LNVLQLESTKGAERYYYLCLKAEAVIALIVMNFEELVSKLSDCDCEIRRNFIYKLTAIGGNRGTIPLIAALKDTHEDVRAAAANALGLCNEPIAINPLISVLFDEDVDTRGQAVESLSRLKATSALEILGKMANEDTNAWIREQALIACDMIKLQTLTPEIPYNILYYKYVFNRPAPEGGGLKVSGSQPQEQGAIPPHT